MESNNVVDYIKKFNLQKSKIQIIKNIFQKIVIKI